MDDKINQPRMDSVYRILILSLLNDKPRSGYDLIKRLEGILGNKPSHGKVYPFLSELQKFNYIAEIDIGCDLRSKVVYKLTSNGKELLISTLGKLEIIFYNFLTSCCFCGLKFYSSNPELGELGDFYCCVNCKTAKVLLSG